MTSNTATQETKSAWSIRTDLYNAIIDRIREANNVSLLEIEGKFEEFGVPAKGDLLVSLSVSEAPNAIIWSGVSTEFHDIYDQLACDYRLELVPCGPMTYLFEGNRGPGLPVAKDLTKAHLYKTRHWVPVVFKWHVDSDGVRLS